MYIKVSVENIIKKEKTAQGRRLGKVYKVEEREISTKKKQTKERNRSGPQI